MINIVWHPCAALFLLIVDFSIQTENDIEPKSPPMSDCIFVLRGRCPEESSTNLDPVVVYSSSAICEHECKKMFLSKCSAHFEFTSWCQWCWTPVTSQNGYCTWGWLTLCDKILEDEPVVVNDTKKLPTLIGKYNFISCLTPQHSCFVGQFAMTDEEVLLQSTSDSLGGGIKNKMSQCENVVFSRSSSGNYEIDTETERMELAVQPIDTVQDASAILPTPRSIKASDSITSTWRSTSVEETLQDSWMRLGTYKDVSSGIIASNRKSSKMKSNLFRLRTYVTDKPGKNIRFEVPEDYVTRSGVDSGTPPERSFGVSSDSEYLGNSAAIQKGAGIDTGANKATTEDSTTLPTNKNTHKNIQHSGGSLPTSSERIHFPFITRTKRSPKPNKRTLQIVDESPEEVEQETDLVAVFNSIPKEDVNTVGYATVNKHKISSTVEITTMYESDTKFINNTTPEERGQTVSNITMEKMGQYVVNNSIEESGNTVINTNSKEMSNTLSNITIEKGGEHVVNDTMEKSGEHVVNSTVEEGSENVVNGTMEESGEHVVNSTVEEGSENVVNGTMEESGEHVVNDTMEEGGENVVNGTMEEGGTIDNDLNIKTSVCSDFETYFQGHCYFLYEFSFGELEEAWQDRSFNAVCDVITPGSCGVAIDSDSELNFILGLIDKAIREGGQITSVLTSGFRGCCSCNTSDLWVDWDTKIDRTIVRDLAENLTCLAPSYYVIVGKDSFRWNFWQGDTNVSLESPSHILCEKQVSDDNTTTKKPLSPKNEVRLPTVVTTPTTTRSTPRNGDNSTNSSQQKGSPTRKCPKKCRKVDQYGKLWVANCNTMAFQHCPRRVPGIVKWWCDSLGYFKGRQPDFWGCRNPWVTEAKYMVKQGEPAEDIALMVQTHADNMSFFGHEIPDLLDVLNSSYALHTNQTNDIVELQERLTNSTAFTDIVTGALAGLLEAKMSWLQLNESTRIALGSQLRDFSGSVGFSLASMAAGLGHNYSYNVTFDQENIVILEVLLTAGHEKNSVIRFPMDEHTDTYLSVRRKSSESFNRLRSVGMMIAQQSGRILFPPSLNSFTNDSAHKILNSHVVCFNLQDSDDAETSHRSVLLFEESGKVEEAVSILFQHIIEAKGPEDQAIRRKLHDGEEPTAVIGSAKCVFWNSSLGDHGLWDDTGCRVYLSTSSDTTCVCTHLSTFAVLMDMHNYVGKDSTLEVLSITCSGLSVICLFLTLIVFHGCRSIQGERTTIGKNLCISLLIAHIITLTMLDKSYFHLSDGVCSVVAVFLHYFFLASFCWMAVEGHYLYRLVIHVFDSGRSLRMAYHLIGYGLPALVVAITEIVACLNGDKAYGRDELCWLTTPKYIWAFIGPVIFFVGKKVLQPPLFYMMEINAIVVTLALRAAMAAGMGKGKSRANKVGGWLKGWFSLCSLLGVTWVFGLAFMEYYASFEYIFVILNGCQGVFIFLFRCLLNKQVRSSVLNEARQRASIKKFNRVTGNRSSWYIASQPPSSRHPSVGSGLGSSDSDTEIKQKEDYPDPMAVKSLDSMWSPVYTITPVPNESSNPHSRPWINRGFTEFVNKCPMIEEEKDNDK